jgi:hypothetical protein
LFATGGKFTAGDVDPDVVDTGSKFASVIIDSGGKFATDINTLANLVAKFAAGVVYTGQRHRQQICQQCCCTGGAP